MRPLRVLCYADMDTLISYCVAAAEMLRAELGAHIVMTVVDRNLHHDQAFANYELYDHRSLFAMSKEFVPVDAAEAGCVDEPTAPSVAQPAPRSGVDTDPGSRGISGDRDADVAPQLVDGRRHRFELLGLRKVLARSKKLRTIYAILRNPAILPLHVSFWVRRLPLTDVMSQPVRAWHKGRRVRAFLRAIKPDVIVLAEDNIERLSTTLVNEGRRQDIPSVLLPFTIPNPLEPAKSYQHRTLNQVGGPLSWLVSRLFPKWCYQLGDRKLLRVPAHTALLMDAFGQSSPAPWILNRGHVSRIALDSEAQRDRYLQLGFPPGQLVVVGDINGATLHRGLVDKSKLVSELLARHGLPPGRPLILCGFPPDQFVSRLDDSEFQSYDSLLDAWIESFKALGERANVLIRPHPRTSLDRFKAFAGPNIRYSLEPTAELVPLCDLYVASISATIRWALACGIPVINYDTYRYRYGDYDGADGVIHTETLADFRAQLTRFVDDPSFASGITQRQRSLMHRWGIVDDGLPRRFAALVTELTGGDSGGRVPR